jgi:hypothetical protein
MQLPVGPQPVATQSVALAQYSDDERRSTSQPAHSAAERLLQTVVDEESISLCGSGRVGLGRWTVCTVQVRVVAVIAEGI